MMTGERIQLPCASPNNIIIMHTMQLITWNVDRRTQEGRSRRRLETLSCFATITRQRGIVYVYLEQYTRVWIKYPVVSLN